MLAQLRRGLSEDVVEQVLGVRRYVEVQPVPGPGRDHLGLLDVVAKRNAFGRQLDSFEADLGVDVLGDAPVHAIFIRAPAIEAVGDGVEVLARLPDGAIVAARQGNLLATAFHPELTDDPRLHEYFLRMADGMAPASGSRDGGGGRPVDRAAS